MKAKAKILIVDDEPDIRKILTILLENNGNTVLEAADGKAAIEMCADNPDIDLIIMDIMMPEISGVEACMIIRKQSCAPILFLTAKTQESDKAQAYENGGDDYLSKPFSQAELLMKTDSLIRRYRVYKGKKESSESDFHGIRIDKEKRRVYKNDARVCLTDKEYELLLFLWESKGKVLDNETIYEQVWQEKYLASSPNTVMVFILKLRKKLEDDPANPSFIKTVWGKGYQIEERKEFYQPEL